MTLAERFALEGILQTLKPARGLELGVFKGGSLRRLAAHCQEVHAFDLEVLPAVRQEFPGVHFHVGPSAQQLPQFLEQCHQKDLLVDFALVDGDHSTEAVRQDLQTLISSPALSHSLILLHDSANDRVRRGLEQVDCAQSPGVVFVDHDFFPGHIDLGTDMVWGGFSCVVIDRGGSRWAMLGEFHSAVEVIRRGREAILSARSPSAP
jgi:hypothetical protein